MQEGKDQEAFLAIYDEAAEKFLPVPGDLGRIPVTKDGKRTFCYQAVHTHAGTHGTLHLAVDPNNHLYTADIIKEVARRFRRPISQFEIHTNGERGSTPLYVSPGMHLKIVFRSK